jgi:hypothetical protein
MKLNDAKIESLLRQAPAVAPPEGLYEKLEADLPDQAPQGIRPSPFPPRRILSYASLMFICLAAVALGSGIYMIMQHRVKDMKLVPESRIGVNEPFIPQQEDLLPIPLGLHASLLDQMKQVARHEKSTGLKTRGTIMDVQPDGTVFYWRADDQKAWKDFTLNTDLHLNDYRAWWFYNLDGSPLPIKHFKLEVQPKGSHYIYQFEKPKNSMFFRKLLLLKWGWAKQSGQTWKISLSRLQLGGTAFVYCTVVLPQGAERIALSRPCAEKHLDADKRLTLRFEDPTPKDGKVPPIEITYQFPAAK